MKGDKGNIEQLFRDAFEHFEADVDPQIWSGIENQMGVESAASSSSSGASASGAASSGTTGIAGMSGLAKLALAAGVVGVIATTAVLLTNSEDGNTIQQPVVEVEKSTTVDEQQLTNSDQQEVESTTPIAGEQAPEIRQEEQSLPNQDKVVENEDVKDIQVATTPLESESSVEQVNQETPAVTNVAQSPAQNAHNTSTSDESETVVAGTEEIQSPDDVRPNEGFLIGPDVKKDEPEEDLPEAAIYASVRSGSVPLDVFFSNVGSSAEKMTWELGDGAEPVEGSDVHYVFRKNGEYVVTLTIEDAFGNISKDTALITVMGRAYVNVPQVFTPNNDRINDQFFVESENIKTMRCTIMDRAGRTIFKWDNPFGHWDGTDMSGRPVEEGQYMYVVEAEGIDGQEILKKGYVALFRD